MTDGERARRSFLDGVAARLLALVVVLAAGGLIAFYHRADLLPKPPRADAGLNPEFVACRDERVGQVDRMRSDGVIGDAQVESFKERAIAFCAGQFPPDKPAAN